MKDCSHQNWIKDGDSVQIRALFQIERLVPLEMEEGNTILSKTLNKSSYVMPSPPPRSKNEEKNMDKISIRVDSLSTLKFSGSSTTVYPATQI